MSNNIFSLNGKAPDSNGDVSLLATELLSGTVSDKDIIGYTGGVFSYIPPTPNDSTHVQTSYGVNNTQHNTTTTNTFSATNWAYMWRGPLSTVNVGSLTLIAAVGPPTPISSSSWNMAVQMPAGSYFVRASLASDVGSAFDARFRAALATSSAGAGLTEIGPIMRLSETGRYNTHTAFVCTLTGTRYLFFKYLSGSMSPPAPRCLDTFYLQITEI